MQAKTKCQWGLQQLCKSCSTCFVFYCMFYFTCDRCFTWLWHVTVRCYCSPYILRLYSPSAYTDLCNLHFTSDALHTGFFGPRNGSPLSNDQERCSCLCCCCYYQIFKVLKLFHFATDRYETLRTHWWQYYPQLHRVGCSS